MAKRYYSIMRKTILVTTILSVTWFTAICQYYYKDLVSTQQINETFRLYKSNKVSAVKLNSFQGNEPAKEEFICEQRVNLAKNQVTTYTKTVDAGETFFSAFYNPQGLLTKA